MISQSNRLARLCRLVFNNPVKCLATLGVVLVVGVAMPVQAALMSISVNFTTVGNSLLPGEVAGDPGVGAFANWNNMTGGTSLNSLALSDGSVTGVNLAVFTGAPSGGQNNWAGGIDINNTVAAPIGGSAANQKMMASGARSYGNNWNGGVYGNNKLTFTGLASVFSSGYKVYVYQDAGSGNANTAGWGGNAGSSTGTFPDATIAYSPSASLAASANNNAFNNDFLLNNHELIVTQTGGLEITSDTFAFNTTTGHWQTGLFFINNITGIQIVGDVQEAAVVPEPSAWPLAALGSVGAIIAALYFRRRRAIA